MVAMDQSPVVGLYISISFNLEFQYWYYHTHHIASNHRCSRLWSMAVSWEMHQYYQLKRLVLIEDSC